VEIPGRYFAPLTTQKNVNQRLMQKLTPPDRQVHQPPGLAGQVSWRLGWELILAKQELR